MNSITGETRHASVEEWVRLFKESIGTDVKELSRVADVLQGGLPYPEMYERVVLEPSSSVSGLPDMAQFTFPTESQPTVDSWLTHIAQCLENEQQVDSLYHEFAREWVRDTMTSRRKRTLSYNDILTAKRTRDSVGRLFVYTNLVRSSVLSDVKARWLRIVSISPNKNYYVFQHVHYFAVQNNVIDTIEVSLRDKFGESYPFQDSGDPSVLVLHFRRVR